MHIFIKLVLPGNERGWWRMWRFLVLRANFFSAELIAFSHRKVSNLYFEHSGVFCWKIVYISCWTRFLVPLVLLLLRTWFCLENVPPSPFTTLNILLCNLFSSYISKCSFFLHFLVTSISLPLPIPTFTHTHRTTGNWDLEIVLCCIKYPVDFWTYCLVVKVK